MMFGSKEFTEMPMHWQVVVLMRLWYSGEKEDGLSGPPEV